MATSDLAASDAQNPSAESLHQLKELLQHDPVFAQNLRATASTDEAVKLVAAHGIVVSPEALWRHRGTLVIGGIPTWRG